MIIATSIPAVISANNSVITQIITGFRNLKV